MASLPRQKPLAGLHDDWNIRKKRKAWPVTPRRRDFASVEDPRIREILSKIGRGSEEETLARRLLGLWPAYPDATLPELMAVEWLLRNNVDFYFQQLASGGKTVKGGRVPDIVIPMGATCLVILVQGSYWHPSAYQELMTRIIIMSSTIAGMKPWAVVQVWEEQIYDDQDYVMSVAMQGVELPH